MIWTNQLRDLLEVFSETLPATPNHPHILSVSCEDVTCTRNILLCDLSANHLGRLRLRSLSNMLYEAIIVFVMEVLIISNLRLS